MVAACGVADRAEKSEAGAVTAIADLTPSPLPTETLILTEPADTTSPTMPPTATAVPTFSIIPTPPPDPTGESGISYGQPTQLPVISEEEAVTIVRQAGGADAELSAWPREQFTAIYVLLTDLRLNATNSMGTPEARQEPVWIVTVHGLTILPSLRFPLPGETATPDTRTSTELYVVIDAVTGAWVESYTY